MEFWLVYRKEDVEKNKAYIERYYELAGRYGFECRLVLSSDIKTCVEDGKFVLYGPSALPDFAVVRTIDPVLSKRLETAGIRCFNSSFVSEICNNKAFTYTHLSDLGIPMPDSCFIKGAELPSFLKSCPKGKVIKSVAGHGGAEVVLFDGDAEKVLKIMHGSDVVVQDRIGKKAKDLRVYCLGKQILACVLRESEDDFRANFSLGGSVSRYYLKPDEEALVKKIMDHLESDLVGIDFLLDENNNLIFNEIEDVVGARMLYKTTDVDIVDEYLRYIRKTI